MEDSQPVHVREESAKGDPSSPGSTGSSSGDIAASLWQEFARATTLESYCQSWLSLVCFLIPDVSGALVLLGTPDRGPFTPVAVWPKPRSNMKRLGETAQRSLSERRGLVVPAKSDQERYEVAYPLEVDGHLHGVIVIEVGPQSDAQLQDVRRQLYWGSAWLEVLFRRELAAKNAASQERIQTVLDFTALACEQEGFHRTATSFATELAARFHCDRVAVGFLRVGRVRVRALSHTAKLEKQTNLIQAIGKVMDECLDQRAVVCYPLPAKPTPQVQRAHEELAHLSGSNVICSIPLHVFGRPAGVLTLERSSGKPFDLSTIQMFETLGGLVGPLLDARRRDDWWLTTKVAESFWAFLKRLFGPRHTVLKLSAIVLACLLAFLSTVRGDFRVAGEALLEPVVLRAVVAPLDGFIREAFFRPGDVVLDQQVLCVLDDRELKLERLKLLGQTDELSKEYSQAMAKHESAKVQILLAQIDQARAKLALVEGQLARTQLLAPFNGVVVSGDLSQQLGAPVEQGTILFEVAPLDSYRLILQVDERDISEIQVGQHGQLLLASLPHDPIPFTVKKITPVSSSGEGRNFFEVEGELLSNHERLRPGLEGVGKVEVAQRLYVWIWTHELINWVRLTAWKWLP